MRQIPSTIVGMLGCNMCTFRRDPRNISFYLPYVYSKTAYFQNTDFLSNHNKNTFIEKGTLAKKQGPFLNVHGQQGNPQYSLLHHFRDMLNVVSQSNRGNILYPPFRDLTAPDHCTVGTMKNFYQHVLFNLQSSKERERLNLLKAEIDQRKS